MIATLVLALLLAAAPVRSPGAAEPTVPSRTAGPRVLSGPDSATSVARSPLVALAFLVGDWVAGGGGTPGAQTGSFTFEWAAGAHALLRRNVSDGPTGHHEDVMLVHADTTGTPRALYADNEGHVIQYVVTVAPGRAVFESSGPGARFRLTYRLQADSTLWSGFEIAPPGGVFRSYLEGVAKRR